MAACTSSAHDAPSLAFLESGLGREGTVENGRVAAGDCSTGSRKPVLGGMCSFSIETRPSFASSFDLMAPPCSAHTMDSLELREARLDRSGGICPLCCGYFCGFRWATLIYLFVLVCGVDSPTSFTHSFQVATFVGMIFLALLGMTQARQAEDLQRRGSFEALPAEKRSRTYWWNVRLLGVILSVLLWQHPAVVFVTDFIKVWWLVTLFYAVLGMICYAFAHFTVKVCGDILLGLDRLWSTCPLGRLLTFRCGAWIEARCESTILGDAINALYRHIWWRILTLWLLMNLVAVSVILFADPSPAALSRDMPGVVLLRRQRDVRPFQELLRSSWKIMATADSRESKPKDIRVLHVLKLQNDSASATLLHRYKEAKVLLRTKAIAPIRTRWDARHIRSWCTCNPPNTSGVRTTALLRQFELLPILGGLRGREEHDLDDSINEAILFHGTPRLDAVLSIMSKGFDLSLAGSNRGLMYGVGAYFSDMASKSDDYTLRFDLSLSPVKYLLLCKVALGTAMDIGDDYTLPVDLNGSFHSKYTARHRYNEYVIGNSSQAYCPYAVAYQNSWSLADYYQFGLGTFLTCIVLVLAVASRVNRIYPG